MLTAFPQETYLPFELPRAPTNRSYFPFANGKQWCRQAKKAHLRLDGKPNVHLNIEPRALGNGDSLRRSFNL